MKSGLVSFRFLLIPIILIFGFAACVKVTEEPTGKGITTQKLRGCEDPRNKDKQECRIVLAEFTASITGKIPLLSGTLKGTYVNQFFPDGKIQSTTLYDNPDSETPVGITNFTFLPDDKIQLIETNLDTLPSDGTMDTKNTVTHDYQNGKLHGIQHILSPIPSTPTTITRITTSEFLYPPGFSLAPNQLAIKTLGKFSNSGIDSAVTEIQTLNPSELPTKIVNISGLMAGPTFDQLNAQEKQIEYNGDKMVSLTHIFYYCPDQIYPSNPALNKKCVNTGAPPPLTTDPFIQGIKPHLKITTKWNYEGEKLVNLTAESDGNADAHGPNAIPDGTTDYTISCDIEYYPQKGTVIAAFPKEMETFGLDPYFKIKKISCDDKGVGLLSGEIAFDGWKYLWEVTPGGVEPPSSGAVYEELSAPEEEPTLGGGGGI